MLTVGFVITSVSIRSYGFPTVMLTYFEYDVNVIQLDHKCEIQKFNEKLMVN